MNRSIHSAHLRNGVESASPCGPSCTGRRSAAAHPQFKATPVVNVSVNRAVMLLRRIVMASLFLGIMAPGTASGQDDEERPALPDIAPRTVEIRGQLEIHFPVLERQPLIGFNPPPRMVDVTGRRPFTEAYRTGAADLPASPLQAPNAPTLARLEGIERRMGILEARAGRYFSRYLDARIEHGFNPNVAVTGQLRYRGLDGHEPFEFDPVASSASDDLDGRVDLHLFGDDLRGGVGIEGYHASYEMYGATGSFSAPPLIPYPGRTGSNLEASGWIRTTTSGPIDGALRARLSGTSFTTDSCPEIIFGPCNSDQFERNQRTLSIDGVGEFDLNGRTAFAQANVALSGVDRQGLAGTDVVTADAGLGALLVQSPTMALHIGARMLYAGSNDNAGEPDYTLLYVSPDVRLDVYPGTGIQIFAENRPSATHGHLADVYRVNPYVVAQPSLHGELTMVDARAGARFFRGPATVNVEGGLMMSPQYQFFQRGTVEGDYAMGVSELAYDEAQILHAGGDVSVVVGGIATANAGLTWRRGRLTDLGDAHIPYFGAFLGHAMISVPIASNSVVLTATGRYESSRYRDIAQTRRLGDYAALDLRGTFRVNHMIGIVAAVENISAGYLEQWDGYPQPPVIISGGLRLSW